MKEWGKERRKMIEEAEKAKEKGRNMKDENKELD